MPAVKVSTLFKTLDDWENYAAHFYNYKVCDDLPGIFDRDEKLDLESIWISTWPTRWISSTSGPDRKASTTAPPASMPQTTIYGLSMPMMSIGMSTCC